MARITVLHVAGCPHVPSLMERLREVAGDASEIELVEVDETRPMPEQFAGSPTVLIDGRNPFAGEQTDALACALRIPTIDELSDALDAVE